MNEVKEKNPNGRPPAKIDWEKVEELTIAGCLGSEIAGFFAMHPNTFYDHVEKKHGIKFSEFRQQFHSKGDAYLRASQFKKALKGDNSMLIWLGKNRLGQKEKSQSEADEELIRKVIQFLGQQLPPVEVPCRPAVEAGQSLSYQESPGQEDTF
jgi:hypothetical protein